MYLPMRWILFGLALAVLLAMAIPGGVVIEGQLSRNPAPGTSTPFSITVTKGGLEYFGRILISLPEDCRIVPRQLHGGGLTVDDERNVAVISWLKLPEADSFEMLLDLEVAPSAPAGSRTIEWDFSFIRNNDRVSVRPAPFHFEVADTGQNRGGGEIPSAENPFPGMGSTVSEDSLQSNAVRSCEALGQGGFVCTVQLRGIPKGGFVKLTEQLPEGCPAEVLGAGRSVTQLNGRQLESIWFDYHEDEAVTYRLDYCPLSMSGEIIGTLSYVDGDAPAEIPVISDNEPNSVEDADTTLTGVDVTFEVQVSASKKRVVTDYFKEKLNFGSPLVEEEVNGWFKYTSGSFQEYKEARRHRETVSNGHAFIGPFVVARRMNERIPVQEALTRTGQEWSP